MKELNEVWNQHTKLHLCGTTCSSQLNDIRTEVCQKASTVFTRICGQTCIWTQLLGIPGCRWERNPELEASGHSRVQEGCAEAWVLNSGCFRPPLESYGHQGPPPAMFQSVLALLADWFANPHTGALRVLQDNPGGEICSGTWEPRGTQTSVRKTADTPVRYEFHCHAAYMAPTSRIAGSSSDQGKATAAHCTGRTAVLFSSGSEKANGWMILTGRPHWHPEVKKGK